MSTYAELKEKYRELARKRSIKTPKDLTTILDDIDLLFSKYGYSTDDEEKETLLSDIEEMLQRYEDVENIIFYVGTSVTPYNADDLIDTEDDDIIPRSQYGVSGEFILEKVHRESGLRRKDNTVHKLFVELIGRWIDEWDSVEEIRKYSLRFATGLWLDELANNYNIYRTKNESDSSLRERVLQKRNELFTTPTLKEHSVTLFTSVENPKTQLTSKNTYLSKDYFAYGSTATQNYYNNNYVCWRSIKWL